MRSIPLFLFSVVALAPHAPSQQWERAPVLPLVPNAGQWDPAVRFAGVAGARGLWLTERGWTVRAERLLGAPDPSPARPRPDRAGAVVGMEIEGAAPRALEAGAAGEAGYYNYFVGPRSRWVSNLHAVDGARYREILPGVDVEVRSLREPVDGGVFEYDLILDSAAALESVVIRCSGLDSLDLEDGRLVGRVATDAGPLELCQQRPVAWFEAADGERRPVACRFRLLGDDRFGFELDGQRPGDDWALVVDPGVLWAGYLGGSSSDTIYGVAFDKGVGATVCGWAGSTDFPTVPGSYRVNGGGDGFVARTSPDGSQLLFSTYVGAAREEEFRDVVIAPDGGVVVCGWSSSASFPTTPGVVQPAFGGRSPVVGIGDAVVCRLDATGSRLEFSTFLGGGDDDIGLALDVMATGELAVVGWTTSPDFPATTGAFKTTLSSPGALVADGFVARLSPDATAMRWATYLGGSLNDELYAVDIDDVGQVTVGGAANSADVVGISGTAFQPNQEGVADGYLARVGANGRFLFWSGYLGGTEYDEVRAVRVLSDGRVAVAGTTRSADLTIPGAPIQTSFAGLSDVFVAVITGNARSLEALTYLGGPDRDLLRGLDVDATGELLVVGECGDGLPVSAAASQPQFGGGDYDGFVFRLTPDLERVVYGTYLGGSSDDYLFAVSAAADGTAVAVGQTWSADVAVAGSPVQPGFAGVVDGVVAQVDTVVSLSGAVQIDPANVAAGAPAAGTTTAALAVTLTNTTPRDVLFDRLDVLIAGAGNNLDLAGVRLYFDREGDGVLQPTDVLLAGPVPVAADNSVVQVAFNGTTLLPGVDRAFIVALDLRASCPLGAEFVVAVESAAAWGLAPSGPQPRPILALSGPAMFSGPVVACGGVQPPPADLDGDGAIDVGDLRGWARRLGETGVADPDGDGVVAVRDLDLIRARLLGRPFVALPASVDGDAGGLVTVRGLGLAGVSAMADGVSIPVAASTDREAVLRLPVGLAPGAYSLSLSAMDRRAVTLPLNVR